MTRAETADQLRKMVDAWEASTLAADAFPDDDACMAIRITVDGVVLVVGTEAADDEDDAP
jgi:hypothetical protein